MANTYEKFTTTGQTVFTLPFSSNYLLKSHVKVYKGRDLLLETQTATLSEGTDYTFSSATQITLSTGLASGEELTIQRQTPDASQLSPWNDGSNLTAEALNKADLQCLYVVQEQSDLNALNAAKAEAAKTTSNTASTNASNAVTAASSALPKAGGSMTGAIAMGTNKITGLGDPTAAQDAATKNYLDTNFQSKSAKLTELATMAQNTADALADLTATEVQAIDGLTASTDELNKLDGVTATTAELNYVDGVTSNIQTQLNAKQAKDDELTELATMGSTTASALADLTQAEVQILDGATVSTDELNKLDGVTASTTEINKLDGVTASTAEINKLDGVTATTAELNKLDGVTATTDELNKTDGLLATPAELNALDGITSNTSELNKLDGVTASTTELNIVAGKTFRASTDGALSTTSDTEMPSSKVIANHVAAQIGTVGGFTTIANDASFPATASQPATGVIISISDAQGIAVSGTTSTTGRTVDGTPATVTINNFPSSLTGETLASGVGLLVTSTGSGNIYNYHKLLAAESDVKQLSDDINDFNARYRIASSAPGSNNDDGDLWFDTSAKKMKVYNGTTSAWDDVASVGNFFINTLSSSSGSGGGSATFNGTATRFTLSNPPTMAQQLIVSVNGVIQKPNSGTSPSEGFAISGSDIIFSAAPASGSDFFIITQGSSVSIGTPSDNTVTAGKIVDGEITDAKISSSANIAGSKLKDDSIPEVKLDVHNAPATGKYLKYTSNGMEWSDGASEGTDVKSTNESGGTKFLREDGDGTCSWQNVTGFVSTSNASTSVGQLNLEMPGDEALKINQNFDSKIILQGSSNPFITFREATTGKAVIGWNSDGYFKLENSEDGSQLRIQDDLKFSVDGTTFYSVLTSNSTLDSTKLSPAISSSPEVSGTASGAITIGKPVAVNTDGTFSQVVETITVANPPTTTGSKLNVQTDGWGAHSMIQYDEDIDRFVAFYNYYEDSGKLKCALGTPQSDGTVSFSNITTLTSTEGSNAGMVNVGNGKFVLTFNENGNSNYTTSNVITATGSGISIGTGSTFNNGSSTTWSGYRHQLAWNASTSYVYFMYRYGGSGTKLNIGTVGTSSVTWVATLNAITNSNSYADSLCYDPDTERVIAAYRNSSGTQQGYIKVLTNSSGTVTMGAAIEASGSDSVKNNAQVVYDTHNDRVIYLYWTGSSGSYVLKTRVGTVTGGSTNSISFGTAQSILSPNQSYGGSAPTFTAAMDNTGHIMIMYGDSVGESSANTTNGRAIVGTITGGSTNSISFGNSMEFHAATQYPNDNFDLNTNTNSRSLAYNPDKNNFQGVYTEGWGGNSNGYGRTRSRTLNATTASTNVARHIGFAQSAVSNGAAIKVDVSGATNNNQSSLTAGSIYYVQDDGTISTTSSSVKAGIALSATKLLIQG